MYISIDKNEISFLINFEDLNSYTQQYFFDKLGLKDDIIAKTEWQKATLTTVYWQKTEDGKLIRIKK